MLTLGASGAWDSNGVGGPNVYQESSTSYQMWYTGTDAAGDENIGYATSTDGIHWTKYSGNPVLSAGGAWEGHIVFKPWVIHDGSEYKMWYIGTDVSNTNRIGYATSTDGIHWNKYSGNPVLDVGAQGTWDEKGVGGPTIMKVGSTYELFFAGSDGVTTQIGHATSSDGIHWTKDAANPVLNNGAPGSWSWTEAYAPDLVQAGGAYLLFYSGGALPGSPLPDVHQTGYAVSSDLSHWNSSGPLLDAGALGDFDSQLADRASVVVNGTALQMWYAGQPGGGSYQIGYATGQICSTSAQAYLPLLVENPASSCEAYYTDDFSYPYSGWSTYPPAGTPVTNSQVDYTGGEYQILVNKLSSSARGDPEANAVDFTASVTANQQSNGNGEYGIMFGLSADGVVTTSYQYLISGNQYELRREKTTTSTSITVLQPLTTSAFINSGTSQNRMEVVVNGDIIALYANSQLVFTMTDPTYPGLGKVGLIAVSRTDPVDARFNSFVMGPPDFGGSCAD